MDIKDGINTNIVRTNYLTNPSVGPKSVKTGLWFDPVTKTVKISKNLDVENPVNVVWDEVATKCDIPLRHDVAFFYTEEFRYNFMYPYRYEYPYSYSYEYPYSYSYSYDHYYNYHHYYNYEFGYDYSYGYPYSYAYEYSYGYNYEYNYNHRYAYPANWVYCYTYYGPTEILYHTNIFDYRYYYSTPAKYVYVSGQVPVYRSVSNYVKQFETVSYTYHLSEFATVSIPGKSEVLYFEANEATLDVAGPIKFLTTSRESEFGYNKWTEINEYFIFAYGYKKTGYSIFKKTSHWIYDSSSGASNLTKTTELCAVRNHWMTPSDYHEQSFSASSWWSNVFNSTPVLIGSDLIRTNPYTTELSISVDYTSSTVSEIQGYTELLSISEMVDFSTEVKVSASGYWQTVYETDVKSEIVEGKSWNDCISVPAPLPGDSTENTCELVAAKPTTRNVSSIYRMLNPKTSEDGDPFTISYNIDGVSIEEIDGQYKEVQHLSLYVNNGTWYGDGEQVPSSKNGANFDVSFLADEIDLTQTYYIAVKPNLEFGTVSSINDMTLMPESELESFIFASPEAKFIGAIEFDGEQDFDVIQCQTNDIVYPVKFGVASPFVLNRKTLDESDGNVAVYEAKGGIINFNKKNEAKFKFEVLDFTINLTKTQLNNGGYVAMEVKYKVTDDAVELVSASPKFFKSGSAKALKFDASEEVSSFKNGVFKHWIPLSKIKENSVQKFKILDPEIINYGFLESTLNV